MPAHNQTETDKADHAAHRQKLETLFKSRPGVEIEADELIELVGTNYHQRISELRTGKHGTKMRLKNVTRFRVVDGVRHRAAGAYLLIPHEPLGRDSTKPTAPHGNRLLFDLHPRS